ncbi:MAG: FAD/NAD(P)-binding protein, partial [Tepidiformaceae bacterium]
MTQADVDTAIVGAGPYGLGLAAHLSRAGVSHRIFGRPMEAWAHMSPGMYLKSFAHATNIAVPGRNLTLPDYCRERDIEDYEPVPIAAFTRYGKWVQEQLVPNVEPFDVTAVRADGDAFAVTIESGERVRARRVVVAV